MRKPNPLLKVAVLSSSILLFGGCVAYRGGVFQSLLGSGATPPGNPGDGARMVEPELWSGSKSIQNKGVTLGLTPAGEFVPPETEQPPAAASTSTPPKTP